MDRSPARLLAVALGFGLLAATIFPWGEAPGSPSTHVGKATEQTELTLASDRQSGTVKDVG
jgi:hypothetical protein